MVIDLNLYKMVINVINLVSNKVLQYHDPVVFIMFFSGNRTSASRLVLLPEARGFVSVSTRGCGDRVRSSADNGGPARLRHHSAEASSGYGKKHRKNRTYGIKFENILFVSLVRPFDDGASILLKYEIPPLMPILSY